MGRPFVKAADGSVSMDGRLEQFQDPIQEQRMLGTCYMYNQDALNSDRYGIPESPDIDYSPRNRRIWLTTILLYMVCNPNQAIDDYYANLKEYILTFLERLDLDAFINILDWCTSYTNIYMELFKEKERKKIEGYVKKMLMKAYYKDLISRNFLNSINVNLRQ